MTTVSFSLNGQALQAEASQTILQVAREHGVEIPTLCYDPRLPPYGSCLVCVVEIRNTGRLLMSCTTPVAEGMDIWTHSEAAMAARKSALEMLLSNHYADCRGPCFLQCPANVDVQGYLAFANAGMYREALDLIRETNPMPLSCGRVCVRYCEANCRRQDVDSPGAINFMKRYVADLEFDKLPKPEPVTVTGKKVAVIGGGPSGLTCAYYLRQKGHAVTLFDQQPKLGGMLRYGIPEYRLPEEVLDKEIAYLLAHGIEARSQQKLGVDFTLDALKTEGYDGIYLALGSWVAKGMGIENETHPNILPGIVFLEATKREGPPRLNGTVAVVGGGNTAIDAARTALRCGAEKVAILYRRTRTEMPADDIEVEDALEEGVEVHFLTAPKGAVIEEGRLLGLECYLMELGEPDASGRRRPVQVKGSDFLFKADWIISAIGQEQDLSGLDNQSWGEIQRTKWNSIQADPGTFMTSVLGIFAGGDAMTGPAAAIDAIGAGRKAALVMDHWLKTGLAEPFQTGFVSKRLNLSEFDPSFFEHFEKTERSSMPKLDEHARAHSWEEVDTGVTAEQVQHETNRCLSCGCTSVFHCDLKDFAGDVLADQQKYKGRLKKHPVDDRHPYILLDSNKCILCGRCVRYCGELIGIHALGFIHRGYETVVKPMLDKPLAETPCIACGNCIEVCPTGAITFKAQLDKPGPFRTVAYRSVCSFCGVGCELDVNHAGRDYFFMTAKPEDPFTEGELCAKGRFGSLYLGDKNRLGKPESIASGPMDMNRAAQELKETLHRYKGEEILFLASPRISNETAFLLASLAKKHGSRYIFTPEDFQRGDIPDLSRALGHTGSTAHLQDLDRADLIVTIGEKVVAENQVLGFKLRRALQKGTPMLHLGAIAPEWKRLAANHLDGAEAPLLESLCGALLATGGFIKVLVEKAGNGAAFQARTFPHAVETLQKAAALFQPGQRILLLVNRDSSSLATLSWAADLALMTGARLLLVRNEANGQGFQDIVHGAGFSGHADLQTAREALAAGRLKALVAVGTDPTGLPGIQKLEYRAALDILPTPFTEKAHWRGPLVPLQEEDGSIVSLDGSFHHFRKAFQPLAGYSNLELFSALLEEDWDLESVRLAIAQRLPLYCSYLTERPKANLQDEIRWNNSEPYYHAFHMAATDRHPDPVYVDASSIGNYFGRR